MQHFKVIQPVLLGKKKESFLRPPRNIIYNLKRCKQELIIPMPFEGVPIMDKELVILNISICSYSTLKNTNLAITLTTIDFPGFLAYINCNFTLFNSNPFFFYFISLLYVNCNVFVICSFDKLNVGCEKKPFRKLFK